MRSTKRSRTRDSPNRISSPSPPCSRLASRPSAAETSPWARSPTACWPSSGAGKARRSPRGSRSASAMTAPAATSPKATCTARRTPSARSWSGRWERWRSSAGSSSDGSTTASRNSASRWTTTARASRPSSSSCEHVRRRRLPAVQTRERREPEAEDDDLLVWLRDSRGSRSGPRPRRDGPRTRPAGRAGERGNGRGTEAYRRAQAPIRRKRSRDVHVRVIGIAAKARDRAGRVRAAAIELTRELEVVSIADWDRVLAGLGIPQPEEALATLVRDNAEYETKAGFYRSVILSP